MDMIDRQMKAYVDQREIAGAALIVRKHHEVLYRNKWGFADLEKKMPVEYDTIFRLASLTKPVTAVAVMMLVEQGKLRLDEEAGRYIPELDELMVCKTPIPMESLMNLDGVDLSTIELEPAKRNVTIRDLLTHSSGLGMGIAGMAYWKQHSDPKDTLESRFRKMKGMPADFHPGEATGYSGLTGMDALGRIIEVVSGMNLEQFFTKQLFEPLGMKDTAFHLQDHQQHRLAVLYKSENGEIFRAPAHEDKDAMAMTGPDYHSGAAGLYSTLDDFDRFAQMLLHEGKYNGVNMMHADTVKSICQERAYKKLEFAPGLEWGLGMLVRTDPERAQSPLSQGSYGWSGAFGTHFFIDPVENISVVLMLNRSNIGGAASYVSKKTEDLVYAQFKK